MRIKMVTALLISAFVGAYLLSSCSDEEEVIDPKSYSWWGYFHGTIDREEISIKNEIKMDSYLPINTTPCRENSWDPRVVKGARISVIFNKDEALNLMIYRFSKGKRYILNGVDYECNNDGVRFCRGVPKGDYTVDARYTPAKNKPFVIDITNVKYYPTTPTPLIEAKISGVLYMKDNPQDSVVINGCIGVR